MWGAIAALVTIIGNLASGYFASRFAGLKKKTSFDIGFTLSARGEFSIIMANIGKAGGLNPIIQSFVVVYVLILAIIAPILTKESRNIWHGIFGGVIHAKDKQPVKTLEALEASSSNSKIDVVD